ncbi:MAG: prepilin peptidase [Alphaproteobacteria bacterium]|nr:prepilin peptidase [Alphaproteobacteria bacterium]
MPLAEIILIIALGLTFGSFVTCMSHRLPLGEDIVKKPSYCPSCDAVLTVRDLWPVFSWLASRGKCNHCKAPVSIRYPLIELMTATLFLLAYLQYGLSVQTAILCLMSVALMIMIVVDLEHYIIPDSVHLALIPLGLWYHHTIGSPWDEVALSTSLMAALALLLHYGYSALRGRVMLGFGDVKFFTVAGLWLGLWPLVPFLFLSGVLGVVLGLIWRKLGKGEVFPFGPALALALYVCVVYKNSVNILYYIHSLFN